MKEPIKLYHCNVCRKDFTTLDEFLAHMQACKKCSYLLVLFKLVVDFPTEAFEERPPDVKMSAVPERNIESYVGQKLKEAPMVWDKGFTWQGMLYAGSMDDDVLAEAASTARQHMLSRMCEMRDRANAVDVSRVKIEFIGEGNENKG